MKLKLFFMAIIAMCSVVCAKSQSITVNYSRVHAGYEIFSFEMFEESASGFNVGYDYAFNITGHRIPLFVELGVEYAMAFKESTTLGRVDIPLSITYKLACSKDFAIAPLAGIDANFNVISDVDGTDIRNVHKVQAGWHAGLNIVLFNKLSVGYRYTDFVSGYTQHADSRNHLNTINFGFCF